MANLLRSCLRPTAHIPLYKIYTISNLSLDSRVLFTALVGAGVVFACFSVAALLARRRSYLYLGGILSSAMSLFITMRFATWFVGGGAALFQAELYGGLLIFAGYVVFDTQLAIEKAESGRGDVISTALDLFVDLVAIFVRLLVILMKNAQSKDEERDRRRPRAGRWARRSEL